MRFAAKMLFCAAILPAAAGAPAQSYPAKPIRVILPFATAGGVDLLTRVLVERLNAE